MHFPDMIDPQNKKEIDFYAFLGWLFFLNDISSYSEQEVRAVDIMGGIGILPLKKWVVPGPKNTPFFGVLGILLTFWACNFWLWVLMDLILSIT